MSYPITLRNSYVTELEAIVAGSGGLDAEAVLVSIVEGYLSPRVDVRLKEDAGAKLAAFDRAPSTATKATILASVAADAVKVPVPAKEPVK